MGAVIPGPRDAGGRVPRQGAMVGTWSNGLELRMSTSTAGLRAVRVASAAARLRLGGELRTRDAADLKSVSGGLRDEARVMRGEALPDIDDETAYAFAGLALRALSARGPAPVRGEEGAAHQLDQLAAELEEVASGERVEGQVLQRIEDLFLATSSMVSEALARTGETVEGEPGTLIGG